MKELTHLLFDETLRLVSDVESLRVRCENLSSRLRESQGQGEALSGRFESIRDDQRSLRRRLDEIRIKLATFKSSLASYHS